MKPNFLNLFMKKLTRDRVVPIISAKGSYKSPLVLVGPFGIRSVNRTSLFPFSSAISA